MALVNLFLGHITWVVFYIVPTLHRVVFLYRPYKPWHNKGYCSYTNSSNPNDQLNGFKGKVNQDFHMFWNDQDVTFQQFNAHFIVEVGIPNLNHQYWSISGPGPSLRASHVIIKSSTKGTQTSGSWRLVNAFYFISCIKHNQQIV